MDHRDACSDPAHDRDRHRKMRQAVHREIEKIGDLADYDVRKIVGRKAASPESVPGAKRPSSQRQATLNFDDRPGEQP